jgi:hypothetical protein
MTSSEVFVFSGRQLPETLFAPAVVPPTRSESNFSSLSFPLLEIVLQSVVRMLPSSEVVNLFVATTFRLNLSGYLDTVIVHLTNALHVSVGCTVVE